MSIPATTTFAAPDPDLEFTTPTALVATLNQLVDTELPDDLTPYVVGSATPAVEDQDKVWHKTDSAGRPKGTFIFYAGTWRQEYTGRPSEARYFFGDPAFYFDANGKGKVGLEWDGWQIMNGLNGTANLSNKFVILGEMDNVGITGFSGGAWRTNIRGAAEQTGGVSQITTTADNTFRPAKGAITAAHYSADGNTRDGTGGIWGKDAGDGTGDPFDLVPADAGKPTPDPINVVPPFFAMCICQFVGYT